MPLLPGLNSRKQRRLFTRTSSRFSKIKFLTRIVSTSAVILSLWVGYRQLQSYWVQADAVLVLGGAEEREHFAAELAQKHPNLDIWVSSGSYPPEYVQGIFQRAGIEDSRLHLDYEAQDTVTNFTTLVDELKSEGIKSVYLVTSENHMGRARIVGEIVFGSRGIVLKPLKVPSSHPPEPLNKSVRDCMRSLLWLTTGYTGRNLRYLPKSRIDQS